MRCSSWLVLSFFVLAGKAALAQDATQQIVQQQSIQIMQQQALQAQQTAQQNVDLINQQQLAQNTNQNLAGYQLALRTPRLKQTAGKDPGTILVEMQDASRGASIFYTTDGWTPTAISSRYMGPVTIRHSGVIRAIAIAPGGQRSRVLVFPVTVPGGATPVSEVSAQKTALQLSSLTEGARLPLVFTEAVTSRGKKVGDPLPIALAEDLLVDGKLLAPKGTPVQAVVTQVDNSHIAGLPGVLSFAVQSIHPPGGEIISLRGAETMEGADRTARAGALGFIPFAALTVHGGDALIPAGTRLKASITKPPAEESLSTQ
ncbi:chitobiase/beta-hexosaminidase C-terminal domain-containing protein [Silvibacterium sp.]|uniref:chitobiase/beta-hexosaminidase C-terminal domain-containing protein n=1 Tax=Silvibacterium sp. TaxID=1964179 RepID=UPI0039E567DB